ncbi:MAG: NAD(P)/FAD-dependent oxidoreductase, partial [Microcoleaceae cyanobacterium]
MNNHRSVCILGGGFGGLYTALRLAQFPWQSGEKPEIILIDQRDRFTFLPLLYELLTGELQTWEIAPPYEELLANTDIKFYQGTAKQIDLKKQKIQLTDEREFNYDRLVLAMGGETPLDAVEGAREYATCFKSIEDAYKLQEKLRILEASNQDFIRIAIVGGGYSGVELACKLADRLKNRGRIRLVEQGDRILNRSPEFNQRAAQQALASRQIWLDLQTKVASMTANSLTLVHQEKIDTIPVDLILWTVGSQVVPLVRSLPLAKNERNQLLVNSSLQVVDRSEIFALGDLAECHDATGQRVPPTAQAALQQADYAAWNIWASMSGKPALPFHYQPFGEMMTLGEENATLTGLGIKLDGQVADVARKLIYLYRMPTLEHQVKVAFNW